MTNNSIQVFAGGWPQLQHAINVDTFFDAFNFNILLAINWKPDGTKFWVSNIDNSGGNNILEYDTVTPHSTTGAFPVESFDTRSIEAQPRGMWWSKGGERLYFTGNVSMSVHQIPAATPYTLDGMNIGDVISKLLTEPSFLTGIYLNPKESKMYISDKNNMKVFEYNLNTPEDITSIVFSGNELVISGTTEVTEVFFKPGSSMMYVSEFTFGVGSSIRRFILSTPGDLSTAVEVDSVSVFDMEEQPQGFFIREHDGKKLYIVGSEMNEVFTYDMTLLENNTRITRFGDQRATRAGEILVNRV